MQSVIEAINKGKVYHYISKPWNAGELKMIMDNALEAYSLKKEVKALQEEKNQLLIQAERQKKEQILSQLETLKNQINPHFLFNSLNALSMLVIEDHKKAEQFISKLTKVYRYVLEYKDHSLISLTEDLAFLSNYFFLQKIRFESGLEMEVDIPAEFQAWSIPPLSLQLLVENAVKHNIVSREKPLKININVHNTCLVVRNTLQQRKNKPPSTQIGLKNLTTRYSYICDQVPTFISTDNEYIAKLPLIPHSELP